MSSVGTYDVVVGSYIILCILCTVMWVHYSRTHDIHEIRISRHVHYIISASRVSQLYAYGASRVPKQHKYDIIYPGAAQDYTCVQYLQGWTPGRRKVILFKIFTHVSTYTQYCVYCVRCTCCLWLYDFRASVGFDAAKCIIIVILSYRDSQRNTVIIIHRLFLHEQVCVS